MQVEEARATFERGPVDLLLLGDSSTLQGAHSDTDHRMIPELVRELSGARSMARVACPGFGAHTYEPILRALSLLPHRPRAVVVALSVRTNCHTHVITHPSYTYEKSIAALDRLSAPLGRIRSLGAGGSALSPARLASFRAQQVTTRWGGTQTIDAHLSRLEGQGPPPWPTEVEQARFDYFHGERVEEDNPGLAALVAFGRRLEEYGVPVVTYCSQPPVAEGERLFPGEFRVHFEGNYERFESALRREAPSLPRMIFTDLADEDYQDQRNGTEHFAFAGRMKVAQDVADALDTLPAWRRSG